MAYRMITVSDTLRVGRTNTGSFVVEVWSRPREEGGDIEYEYEVARDTAEDLARFILATA